MVGGAGPYLFLLSAALGWPIGQISASLCSRSFFQTSAKVKGSPLAPQLPVWSRVPGPPEKVEHVTWHVLVMLAPE